jgi:hypothetical protein
MATKYAGTGYPNGFRPDTKKPLDVRLIVDTIADRNGVQFTFPGMEVTVLGPVLVVAGIDTYPQATVWKLQADRQPVFGGGPTTFDQDWRAISAGGGNGAGYKGPWDASTNTPDLNSAALRATLVAGDFYKVSIPGTTSLNGINTWAQNDSAFWDGTTWARFENTNPSAVNPLYKDTEGAHFQADVLDLIRLNALTQWVAGRAYKTNTFVKNEYIENSRLYIDTWQATGDMTAATSALPTTTTLNPRWALVTTTNGRLLGGTAQRNDQRGRPATGSFTPASATPGEYLSPEEIDARIRQYGGALSGPILGGNASTFLTGDPAEVPRN